MSRFLKTQSLLRARTLGFIYRRRAWFAFQCLWALFGCSGCNQGSFIELSATSQTIDSIAAGGEFDSVMLADNSTTLQEVDYTGTNREIDRDAVSPRQAASAGWAADAIFYQIFPERFCNGDPTNDPTVESLEYSDSRPELWEISRWTSDWYERAEWEQQLGDSFYQGGVFQRRYGGDLQGIVDRLEYLAELGVSAIYFNPLFCARSSHKYDGNSFHHIDPHFGPDPAGDRAIIAAETADPATWQWTAADKLFLEMIRQSHELGIRIVIDGVFNHTGRDFFAFADLTRNQSESPYKDWYIVEAFDDPSTPQNEFRYRAWSGARSLPEFADSEAGDDLHPGPKQYVFDITSRWMDPDQNGDSSDGIDGWRLDVVPDVPSGFWRQWHEHVRKINPDAFTVAEIWLDANQMLADGGFQATMNYHAFAFPVKGFLVDGELLPGEAMEQLDSRRSNYPLATQFALLNQIDSHDTARVASMIVNPGRRPYAKPDQSDYDMYTSPRHNSNYEVRKPNAAERQIQRLVTLMQMTYVGPPMIYYGTEAGMWGADDPCDRMPMVWPEMTFDAQQADPLRRPREPDVVEFDHALHNYYRDAIWLRRNRSALRRGAIDLFYANDSARFMAFRRSDDRETLVVGLNRGNIAHQWLLPLLENQAVVPIFIASGRKDDIVIEQRPDGALVTVPPYDGVVLEVNRNE